MKNENKTLVLSFPRSGMNMFRIFTEFYTDCETPGTKKIPTKKNTTLERKPLAFIRSHNLKKFPTIPSGISHNKMILILRDCKYAFHTSKLGNVFGCTFEDFILNLKDYHNFDGSKMVLYYEEMLLSASPFYAAWDFLEIPYRPIDDFDYAMETSKNIYLKMKGTRKVNNAPSRYPKNISQESTAILQNHLSGGELEILSRYFDVAGDTK